MDNKSIEDIDDIGELLKILMKRRDIIKNLKSKIKHIDNNIKKGIILFSKRNEFLNYRNQYEFTINWNEIEIERINKRLNELANF